MDYSETGVHFFKRLKVFVVGLFFLLLLPVPQFSQAQENQDTEKKPSKKIEKGTFLVATDKLTGSSFNETVILITHHSNWGTTGIAINRPAEMSLSEAFPDIEQLNQNKDELYLGGPVRPESIFVLMQTKRPHQGMRNIADDLYFAPGIMAFSHSKENITEGENARVYAGYSGWAPGQLEHEIRRGDWLVIESKLDIIFSPENSTLWKKLHKDWSGTWI